MVRGLNSTFVVTSSALLLFGVLFGLVSCGGPDATRFGGESVPAATAMVNDSSANSASAAGGEAANSRLKARFVYFQEDAAERAKRIIYTADISLVVKSMTETEAEIGKLLKQYGGYVGQSNVDRRQGENLTGRWQVRMPAQQFNDFLEAVSKLGVAETRTQNAQDVSEEFVDLEAQITNKKRLEERIVGLLKEANGKIKDVIEVEHELARVRGEIEQMEGRLRYLANRTELTTITITARQEENYEPPAAPTFANRVTQAWYSSLSKLRSFGEELLVATVAAAPWVLAFGVVLVPTAWYTRRRVMAGVRSALVDKE
jgi:hypothetical protein